jgi:hypothetical protein
VTGGTLADFARDIHLHTGIATSARGLGHHIRDRDHAPSPTDRDRAGYGEF